MTKKISLFFAILINLNIMIGVGIFINTVELTKRTGAFSAFMYLLIALFTFPLIASFSQLIEEFPEGGFYAYAASGIHPLAGFISTWSYFIGKLGSAMLMIHTAVLLCQQIIPSVASVNTFALDGILIALFVILNLLNVKTGSKIQMGFLGMKLIPLIFVILVGLYFFNPIYYAPTQFIFSGIPSSLPLVLFTMLGFEATISLSSQIENSQKNGPRALYISFFLTVCSIFLFQFFFYGALGSTLSSLANYLLAFPKLISLISAAFRIPQLAYVRVIINLAIASSALGGAYGIIFSNAWNIFSLAEKKLIPFWRPLITRNRFAIPFWCIISEGLVCLIFLLITAGNQLPLQQTAALGVTGAYTLSTLSLLLLRLKNKGRSFLLPLMGLASCFLLIFFCIKNLYTTGFTSLLLFGGIICGGIGLYYYSFYTNKE